ncbi:MAG TPA: hypothetical protein VGP04_19590, partial [Pseudonocardiaceae bacterium]|nr:hypothetical protein [Pseudonocardiaceae bacterium]
RPHRVSVRGAGGVPAVAGAAPRFGDVLAVHSPSVGDVPQDGKVGEQITRRAVHETPLAAGLYLLVLAYFA